MRRIVLSSSILVCLLLATTLTLAQSGGDFEINGFSFGNGETSSGGDFSTTGGPAMLSGVPLTGGDFGLSSGFWQCRDETAVAPQDVTIAPDNNGTDVVLTWSGAIVYAVWQGSEPYFVPDDGQSGTAELAEGLAAGNFSIEDALTTANNSFLVVMGQNECEALSHETSNRVGVFKFGITPGS
ncbi:MAG: hypothetical protein AAF614_02495 [Chloroflexota bacterium]